MEEGFFIILALIAGVYFFVTPVAALVLALQAKRQSRENSELLHSVEELAWSLNDKIKERAKKIESFEIGDKHDVLPDKNYSYASDASLITTSVKNDESREDEQEEASAEEFEVGESLQQEAEREVEEEADEEVEEEVNSKEELQEEEPDTKSVEPSISLEEQIGLVWFTRIGALMGIAVAGWFFKYIFDNDIVGPWGRVAIGVVIGLGLLVFGEILYKNGKSNKIFNQTVQGLGLALLFISAYATSGFYHLVSISVAFGITALLSMLGGALSVRHKSEGILIFSLIAVFLNPVMLSTGKDNPLGLFSYLFVISLFSLFFSVKLNFMKAIYVTIAGVVILYFGWYSKYLNIEPERIINDVIYKAGAYYSLYSRIVPVIVAVIFPGVWTLGGLKLSVKDKKYITLSLFLISAIAMTGALTSLLYDHYIILGTGLLAISALYGGLLIRKNFSQYIAVPMVTSFLTLMMLSDKINKDDVIWIMLLGLALTALFIGMVSKEILYKRSEISRSSLFIMCGSGLLFVILAAVLLLPAHNIIFGIIVVAISLIYLIFSSFLNKQILHIGFAILSIYSLIANSHNHEGIHNGYIYVITAWFLIYILAVSYELFIKKSHWTRSYFALLSGIGIGFIILVFNNTKDSDDMVRSMLFIGAGAIYLVIGTLLLKVRKMKNDLTLLPLGTALGFFGIATGLLLSGVSMTIAFAMEAVVLSYLTSKSKRDNESGNVYWFTGAAVFATVAIISMFSTDISWLQDNRNLYQSSLGTKGLIYATPLLNPFALSRIGIMIFFFMTALFLRKMEKFLNVVKISVVLGHILLISIFASEIQLLFTHQIQFAEHLTKDEFQQVWIKMYSSLNLEKTQRGMINTLVMGVYALSLIILGFVKRDILHRISGIGLFGVTLIKLGLWDIWNLETIYRIVVGATMATALMTGGYLYARFKGRLKNIVTGGDNIVIILLMLSAGSLLSPGTVQADDLWDFENVCPVAGVKEPGDYSLIISPELAKLSNKWNNFSDIRIIGSDGSEVPFTIQKASVVYKNDEKNRIGKILNPVKFEDGSSQITIDFGETLFLHNHVMLNITGTNYMRKTSVESSTDGVTFGLLAKGGLIYDIAEEYKNYINSTITYPVTNARFLRITISKGEDSGTLIINGAKTVISDKSDIEKQSYGSFSLKVLDSKRDKDKRTIVNLGELKKNIPFNNIKFRVKDEEFVRKVVIEASTHKESWFTIGRGIIYKIKNVAGEKTDSQLLGVDIEPTSHKYLRALFLDEDNAPLQIIKAEVTYPLEIIQFRVKNPGENLLYIGNKEATAPKYDLSSIINQSDRISSREVTLLKCKKNKIKAPVKNQKDLPLTEKYQSVLKILMGLVLLILSAWTVITLKNAGKHTK